MIEQDDIGKENLENSPIVAFRRNGNMKKDLNRNYPGNESNFYSHVICRQYVKEILTNLKGKVSIYHSGKMGNMVYD